MTTTACRMSHLRRRAMFRYSRSCEDAWALAPAPSILWPSPSLATAEARQDDVRDLYATHVGKGQWPIRPNCVVPGTYALVVRRLLQRRQRWARAASTMASRTTTPAAAAIAIITPDTRRGR